MLFFLKTIIKTFILPPVMPIILIVTGLVLIKRNNRKGLHVVWAGVLINLFFSIPAIIVAMAYFLENSPPIQDYQLGDAQAIVILGGGQRGWAVEYGMEEMPAGDTLERLCYGSLLARKTHLPILVTGGAPSSEFPEGGIMAKVLANQFGTPATWIEDKSLDTYDNARFSAPILKGVGVHTILLVTHASHMRRALYEFRKMGITVIPAPTVFYSNMLRKKPLLKWFFPNFSSMNTGFSMLHEWVGILAQHIRDIFK